MATQQNVEPRSQFQEVERLGHVVVAARTQATHSLVHSRERTQDQHRRFDPGRSQCRQYAKTVEPTGQHAVEDDRIVGIGGRLQQAFSPRAGTVHGEPVVTQRGADLACSLRVVFDDQNPSHFTHRTLRQPPHRQNGCYEVCCKARFARL